MPKAFTDHEKEAIQAQLLEKGKALFESQGIRKTTVEELTRAVGISKGSFYMFFESKEELYMQILEQLENEIQTRILGFALHPDDDAQENVYQLLRSLVLTMEDFPILKNFTRTDLDYLVRKLPPERVVQHADNDQFFMQDFVRKIAQEGITVSASPEVVGNLVKGLFFLSLHREDYDKQAYEEMMDVLIYLVAGYITGEHHELRRRD